MNRQCRVSLWLTDFSAWKGSEIRWFLKCCGAQLFAAEAPSKHSLNNTHDPDHLLPYSLCSNCLFFDCLLLDNLFFDCLLLDGLLSDNPVSLPALSHCLFSDCLFPLTDRWRLVMGCLLSDCLFSLTESSLWQLRAVLRAVLGPDPSVCLFFLPGPRDSLLSYLCPASVCQRLLTQLSAVCVGGLSPLTTPWSFISLSDALTLFLFSFIPHESLHQSSPLIFWFRASSSLPAYGLNGPINTAHALIQNDTFVWVWMTSQKVKAGVQEMEASSRVPCLSLCPPPTSSQGSEKPGEAKLLFWLSTGCFLSW